jgi:hypothetical protein
MQLRKLDYAKASAEEERGKNKFFKKQEEERIKFEKKRKDKHLLPVEDFKDPVTGKKVVDDFKLPFHTLDIIFNHKNIWANL